MGKVTTNVGLVNKVKTSINPATEDKQDAIIAAISSGYLSVREDDTGTYVYTGLAQPGTATSAASWLILRETSADGTLLYADGDDSFDNIWDNHAALSYS